LSTPVTFCYRIAAVEFVIDCCRRKDVFRFSNNYKVGHFAVFMVQRAWIIPVLEVELSIAKVRQFILYLIERVASFLSPAIHHQ
jgi:hypothetical protein